MLTTVTLDAILNTVGLSKGDYYGRTNCLYVDITVFYCDYFYCCTLLHGDGSKGYWSLNALEHIRNDVDYGILDEVGFMKIVKLHQNFDPDSAERVCKELVEHLDAGETEVVISIDSNGGYVSSLEAIITTIEYCREKGMKVNTYNAKKAFSCGVMLLSFGDKRFMHPNAASMIHDVGVSEFGGGKVRDLEKRVRELREFNEVWMKWLSKNMGISRKKLEKLVDGQDLFLTARESKELGVIDEITIL